MTHIESPIAVIVLLALLGLGAYLIYPIFFLFTDRPALEDFGARRGWILKRTWCLPIPGSRSTNGRTYYRATFLTAEGRKEKIWFEATNNEPIESTGPFGKP